MAKKPKQAKKTQAKSGTNWLVIGGVVVLGAVALFALLYLALREPERLSLSTYCEESNGNCVAYGDENAPVTLVEISDFGCPHCRDFHQTKSTTIMEEYVDQGLVRWLFVPYALRADTVPAANAALCAAEQGKYYEYSEFLYTHPSVEQALVREGLLKAGEEVGLDSTSFLQCLDNGTFNNTVSTNQQAARSAGVNSTPTFFVNETIIRGNVPLEEFERRFSQFLES